MKHPRPHSGPQHRRISDSGETYIELLMTLVIVGLVAVAVLGAIMTSIKSSAEHRNLTNDDTIMKSALEQAIYQIQLQQPTPLYTTGCGSGVATAFTLLVSWNSGMSWPAVPSGIGSYRAWISSIECVQESSTASAPDSNCLATQATPTSSPVNVNSSGCTGDNSGLVELTVSVLDNSKLTSSLPTIVRNPSYSTFTGSTF